MARDKAAWFGCCLERRYDRSGKTLVRFPDPAYLRWSIASRYPYSFPKMPSAGELAKLLVLRLPWRLAEERKSFVRTLEGQWVEASTASSLCSAARAYGPYYFEEVGLWSAAEGYKPYNFRVA